MKKVALSIANFLAGGLHLNTTRGWDFVNGMVAGLKAAGQPEVADALRDWPCQTNEELATTINLWAGQTIVLAHELPAGVPFEG
jgi:hypothetical protein